MSVAAVKRQGPRNKIHAQKFAMLVACASITMMFAAFTSAYIVRQAAGNWLEFSLPNWFFISTGVILLSSLTLQASYHYFKREMAAPYRSLLLLTLLLGLSFVVLQYQGWIALAGIGVELTGNPSGSFVYVISGVHAAHVLGGIGALVVAVIQAYSLKMKNTAKRRLRFDLTITYWHFVGLLWLYIMIFFVLQQS